MNGSIGKAYDREDQHPGRRLACKKGPMPGKEETMSRKEGATPGKEKPMPGEEGPILWFLLNGPYFLVLLQY